MSKKNEAYAWPNAGIIHVLKYPSQEEICRSKDFRRATRKARNLGFDVKVYCGTYAKKPRDAIYDHLTSGSPRKR